MKSTVKVQANKSNTWINLPKEIRELLKMKIYNQLFISYYFTNKFLINYSQYLGFPGGLAVKNSLAMQETPVRFLGEEDPLEKEMATHSSILAWRIRWTEESVGYSPQCH